MSQGTAIQRAKGYFKRLLGVPPAQGTPPSTPQPRRKHLWSIGIYTGTSPLRLAPDSTISNPVLTRDQITDVSAGFVADPFLLHVDETWYLFCEVFNRKHWRGEIGVATSPDLKSWTYQRIVLAEPFHLSYPHIFAWEGEYYMIPETHQTRTIRLYKARTFPYDWTLVHTVMSGERFADTTIFRHDDRWWLFTETNPHMKHDTLRLYWADDLFGRWTEHPASPVVTGDPHSARPGGSVISTPHGLFRFAQDCAPRYGLSVNAFQITELTPTTYHERPVQENPLLSATGAGWNESGMHHIDAHHVPSAGGGDRWIAAVDGWRAATAAEITGES